MKVKKDFIGMYDVLKGILMLFIIGGHHAHMIDVWAHSQAVHEIIDGITRYRVVPMAVFFIISGYDFRPAKDLKQYVKRQALLLLVPYAIAVVIAAALNMVIYFLSGNFHIQAATTIILGGIYGCTNNTEILGISAVSVIALWFLPTLFLSGCIQQLISKIENVKIRAAIVWGLTAIAIFFPPTGKVQLPFFIVQACAALGFLETGRLLKRDKLLFHELHFWVIILAAMGYVFCRLYSRADMATNVWRFGPVSYATAIMAAVVILWFYLRSGIAIAEHLSLLEYLGRYSLYVLCIHGAEMLFFPWYADRICVFFQKTGTEKTLVYGGIIFVIRVFVIMLGCAMINVVRNRKVKRVIV